jgi:hypothetical protein
LEALRAHARAIAGLASNYLEHRFDLLGSGWVQVRHGMRCRGLEGFRYDMGDEVAPDPSGQWLARRLNRANAGAAARIWRLVDPDYKPIDWHVDFKSGYRWSESTWYRDIPYGHLPGVDVKVPWELARMQHLPTLAWAYALSAHGEPGFEAADTYAREFRNQVLDFVAANPPRYGVNWRTTMDVAIRVANWLLAFDLFRAVGARFDDAFESTLRRSVFAHGRHIATNLEWYPTLRGNHYLSNVAGLLFVGAYLPRTPGADVWLAFAVQELVREVRYQFTPDGASFEASTSYHRLTAQMAAYCTAVVLGLRPDKQSALRTYDAARHSGQPLLRPAPLPHFRLEEAQRELPFPPAYVASLERMGAFTSHVRKPDGHIHQVGDNDSGQFFKLQPLFLPMSVAEARALFANLEGFDELHDGATYWHYDDLDHRTVPAMLGGLFARAGEMAPDQVDVLDGSIIQQLAAGTVLPRPRHHPRAFSPQPARMSDDAVWERLCMRSMTVGPELRTAVQVHLPEPTTVQALVPIAYPDFGLYIFRSECMYLAVRCGPIGQAGNGGHAHNDQLAVELQVNGQDWLLDPGTYLYTPLPRSRDAYRSVQAHFAPRIDGTEPGRIDIGLFALGNEARAECLYFGPRGFAGRHRGYGAFVYRLVELHQAGPRIVDFAEGGLKLSAPLSLNPPPYSPAYGVRWRRAVPPRTQ